jgi:hypothetical protein
MVKKLLFDKLIRCEDNRRLFYKVVFTLFASILVASCSQDSEPNVTELAPVTQEIRYRLPEAGEVTLVWGVDGWGMLPEEEIPPGTEIEAEILHTSMSREGDDFVARLVVPAWTLIDFGFLVSETSDGTGIKPIWDGSEDYQSQATEQGQIVEIEPDLTSPIWEFIGNPDVIQEFRHTMPGAGEVFLVWGVDGWGILPENMRPADTIVVDNLMRTLMHHQGETFSVEIKIPLDSLIDFGFLITKTSDGSEIQPMWEGSEDFQFVLYEQSEAIEVVSELSLENALVIESPAENSHELMNFIYHLPGAGSVDLVWGIDGWLTLPEDQIPDNIKIKNGVMHTIMDKQGDNFLAIINFPPGSQVDYGFLITSTQDGEPENIWEAEGDSGYYESITSDGILTVQSGVILPSIRSATTSRRLVVALYIVISVIIVFFVGYLFDYRL